MAYSSLRGIVIFPYILLIDYKILKHLDLDVCTVVYIEKFKYLPSKFAVV